ncbi:MAG TPA: biopolymer transporter ExbD, partial [Pyrinomonadaceae bacterium]|nr:biopolymer transporter ExbD [Pyrinomonadaceae bacterium]
PLIDVLLVLLIIFMVISPLRPSRFKTTVPEPPIDDKIIHRSPRTLIVDVGRDSRVKLIKANEMIAEGWVNDSGAVAARLTQEFAERKVIGSWKPGLENSPEIPADERIERTVFLKAPRSVAYGEVAKVIDGIKGAGASPVGLQIDELID